MKTKILKCTCQNDYQDEKYGKGNRVFNQTSVNKGTSVDYRCTVCETIKTVGDDR